MSPEDTSRAEARELLAKFLGQPLPSFAIVHHMDGNPFNNAINNLQVVTRADHARIHAPEKDQRHGRKPTNGRDLPKGIYYDSTRDTYKCSLRADGKRYQGRAATLEEAIEWRRIMEEICWDKIIKGD